MSQTPDGAAPLVPAAVAAALAEQIRGIAAAPSKAGRAA